MTRVEEIRVRRFHLILVLLLATAAVVLVACGDDDTTTDDPEPGTSTEPADDDDTTTASVDVGLYFVREITEPSAGGVVEAIAATRRAVDVADGDHPAVAASTALLDGPAASEAEIGMMTAVPSPTALLGVTVSDGVATIDLDAAFEQASGAFSDTLRVAQIVFTLTAFDDVDTVLFAIDGEARDVVGSHGIEVAGDGDGIGRDDVPEARPPILLETPAPGDDVTDPLTIAGEANTFEGTVRWSLTDPEGLIVDEGFLTATAGSGVWGTFSEEIGADAAADRGGVGSVILWEDSPEDGRQTNIVEVPITWPVAS